MLSKLTKTVSIATAILLLTSACDRPSSDEGETDRGAEEATSDEPTTEPERATGEGIVIRAEDDSGPRDVAGEMIGRESATRFGMNCTGYIEDEPSFSFEVGGDEPVEVVVSIDSAAGIDATLVLDGPGGPYCDDDGAGGLLPRIRQELVPGQYTAYVGSYQQNQGARYEGSVGVGQPAFLVEDCDATRTINIDEGFERQTVSGSFDGNGRGCSDAVPINCDGSLSREPGPCVEVTHPRVVRFGIERAAFDTTLVLQSSESGQSEYNDDGPNGTNSQLIAMLQPGRYALHVGAYVPGETGTWSLTADTFDLGYDPETGELAAGEAEEECTTVSRNTPLSFVATTEPEIECSSLFENQTCVGWLPTRANHCIVLEEGMSVEVTVSEASFDTVLAIDSNDLFLSDDDGGENLLSRISSPMPAGTYQIFVGGIDGSARGPYRLEVKAH